MNNDFWLGQAIAEQVGHYKRAAQNRANRLANNTPSLRDRVRHLARHRGVYLVGASSRGRYKIGFAASLRDGIGSCESLPVKIDVVMWCETPEAGESELKDQLHRLFQAKRRTANDLSGIWFELSEADFETLRRRFHFISL